MTCQFTPQWGRSISDANMDESNFNRRVAGAENKHSRRHQRVTDLIVSLKPQNAGVLLDTDHTVSEHVV